MGKTILFAPVTFDLAETTRMIEIAKGIQNHPAACQVFEIQSTWLEDFFAKGAGMTDNIRFPPAKKVAD